MLGRSLRLAMPALVILCGIHGFASGAQAARNKAADPAITAQSQAETLIQNLGDRAVATLADQSLDGTAKNLRLQNMMRESFDLMTIGRFVIGRNAWAGATPEQRQEYLSLFDKLVIKIYSDRFALYSGQRFKTVSSRPEGERDIVVKSQVVQPDEDHPIEVEWRVRNFDGRLSVTQRQEYGAVIQRHDGSIEELLKRMHESLDQQDARDAATVR